MINTNTIEKNKKFSGITGGYMYADTCGCDRACSCCNSSYVPAFEGM